MPASLFLDIVSNATAKTLDFTSYSSAHGFLGFALTFEMCQVEFFLLKSLSVMIVQFVEKWSIRPERYFFTLLVREMSRRNAQLFDFILSVHPSINYLFYSCFYLSL